MFPILCTGCSITFTNSSCLTLQWLSIVSSFCREEEVVVATLTPAEGLSAVGEWDQFCGPGTLNEGWTLDNVNLQYHQHFLFGKHFNGIPLRVRQHQPQVVNSMSTYIFITAFKCYRKLSDQSQQNIFNGGENFSCSGTGFEMNVNLTMKSENKVWEDCSCHTQFPNNKLLHESIFVWV